MNDPQDATIAKTLSLREALSWVKDQGITNVIFEIDAQSVVLGLHKCLLGNSYLGIILQDCNQLLCAIGNAHLVFVKRSVNNVAHCLARASCSLSYLQQWNMSPPDFI